MEKAHEASCKERKTPQVSDFQSPVAYLFWCLSGLCGQLLQLLEEFQILLTDF